MDERIWGVLYVMVVDLELDAFLQTVIEAGVRETSATSTSAPA